MPTQDAAGQFLSNVELYGKPVLGSGKVDLFAGGFNKDQLARFWLGQFAPFAIDSARQKRDALKVGQSEAAISSFRESEQQGQQAYGQFGGNPELFRRGEEQRQSALRGQLAGLGAQAEAGYAQDVFSSLAGASQQASAAVLQQKSLDQQRYLANQARKAIKKARRNARKASYIQAAGAVISAVGAYSNSAAVTAVGAGLSSYGGARNTSANAQAAAHQGGLYPGLINSNQQTQNWSFWGNNWGSLNPFGSQQNSLPYVAQPGQNSTIPGLDLPNS